MRLGNLEIFHETIFLVTKQEIFKSNSFFLLMKQDNMNVFYFLLSVHQESK
jgi:hypothetical protein